jgi:AraC-like DNA-binding protein
LHKAAQLEPSAFRIAAGRTPGVHAVLARTAHTFDRHTHDDFGIGVITSGAQRWHSGRAQVEAGTGSAIAVNAGEVHDGTPIGEGGRAWRMLYISPPVLQAAAAEVFEGVRLEFEFLSPVLSDSRVAHLVLRLLAAETGVAADRMRSEELLLALIARAGQPRSAKRPLMPLTVATAKQRIDDDPASTITLGCLARLSGVSRFQLVRSFARATGFTPHAYVVQRRIDLARRLIFGGEELAKVAAAAGFADQSHMTRTFVRKYGVAPGGYARALR